MYTMIVHTNRVRTTASTSFVNFQSLVSSIFPEYNTPALDIPYYDSEKHMYIVDQYTSESGNRHVTYVSVGRHLCVEVALTMYHSWTLMSSMRVMIPNVETQKVVKTF